MTNQEKAREYAAEKFKVNPESKKWNITTTYMSACEWKDQQFKEYLQKMREEHIRECQKCTDISQYNIREYHSVRVGVFNEIINELFGWE